MRYSPSTKAFYPDHLDYPNLPEDLVTVSPELHQEWMNAPHGASVLVAPNGRVSLVMPEETSLDALKDIQVDQLHREHAEAAGRVSFANAAGLQATFGNKPKDLKNVQAAIALGEKTWKPIGLWLDISGRPVTPFSFADLKGLSSAMEEDPEADHVRLLGRIRKVLNAKTQQELEALAAPAPE